MIRIVGFVLLLLFPGLDLYALSGAGAKVAREGNLNVLLITLDTMRADRLGAYGWGKARTPNIDALAAGGVRFAHAYCPAPLTLPSHCSILTGTYPLYHKVRNNGSYYLGPEAVTLAERLRDRGFRDVGFRRLVQRRFAVRGGPGVHDIR